MKQEILHISNLTIGYGQGKRARVVHKNLNAKMYSGELLCLLGENGSGKSTLIRTICGFQPELNGNASVFQKDMLNLSEKELSKIVAVVLTDRVVVPNATVEELVALGRSPYTGTFGILNKEDKSIVHGSMVKCGIIHKKSEPLSNLSDGEKQKAFIAKALAQDTPIIILDEPTAFLDLSARVEIMHLLRQIAGTSGKSVLMSTHDLDLALQMADRMWLFSPDNRFLMGSPEDLLLKNEIQQIFRNKGIVFDKQTGLFRVEHNFKSSIPIEGNGFEYLLINRAFARKGIKIVEKKDQENTWLKINNNEEKMFSLYVDNEQVINEASVEKLLALTDKILKG